MRESNGNRVTGNGNYSRYSLLVTLFLLFSFVICHYASAISFDLSTDKKFIYEYHLLPSASFKNFSSALFLYYPVKERTGFELQYISIDNPYFTGNAYFFSYYIHYGLEKQGFIIPTLVGGYRMIDTPETGFFAPLDFGIILEFPIGKLTSLRLPLILSLFTKDNLIDFSFSIERKEFFVGDLVLGVRNLAPMGNSNFADRKFLLIGLRNKL